MRLWSIHPMYLDVKGLVALWREGLLAQKVLQGTTRGYRRHPQLRRFQSQADPLGAIGAYLEAVANEAASRGYRFDAGKIHPGRSYDKIPLTRGQLHYEWEHLRSKLSRRDMRRYQAALAVDEPETHPLFVVVAGEPADWEVARRDGAGMEAARTDWG